MDFKKKLINLSISLLAIFSTTCLSAQVQEPMNILFIGNSFTFRHDLNLLVEQLVKEGQPDINIYTEKVVAGGQSLFQHTEYYFSHTFIEQSTITNAEIKRRISAMKQIVSLDESPAEFDHFWSVIRGQSVPKFPKANVNLSIKKHQALLEKNPKIKWDYVVLQSWRDENSDFNEGYAKYAKQLSELARANGAKVILYWTAPDFQNQSAVTEPVKPSLFKKQKDLMLQIAREIKPYAVIPAPVAVNNIQKDGTEFTFRYENDAHPNQRMAFLTSNMLYVALFKESTEGFAFDTVTETTDKGQGEGKDPDGGDATKVFKGSEKSYLQKIAYDSFMEFDKLYKGDAN